MSPAGLLFFCVQNCFIQTLLGQCIDSAGPLAAGYSLNYGAGLGAPYSIGAGVASSPFGLSPTAVELGAARPYGLAPIVEAAGAYGGSGIGKVVVTGDMPVVGTTVLAGQVPILGAVRFTGDLPAAGTVSISGSCGCRCGNPAYIY